MWKFLAALSFAAVALVDARHCLYDNRPLLESCGRGCMSGPGKAACVTRCLVGRRVSGTCARCLGNGFDCALRSCRSQCQRGLSSRTCTDCVSRSCGTCSWAGKSMPAVNETEMSQILAEVVFSSKEDELEQAKNEEPEPAEQPKAAEASQEQSEERVAGCWENRPALKACGTRCFSQPNRGRCATQCLRDSFGMSSGCASCFGDKVACTIQKCLSKCAGSDAAPACINCVRSKCGRCNMNKASDGEQLSDEVLNAVVELATAEDKASEKTFYP